MKSRLHSPHTFILASTSAGRHQQLTDAGLACKIVPPMVDEDQVKDLLGPLPPRDLALNLAREKGLSVSTEHPETITIAGDQVCECEGDILHKPLTNDRATTQLRQLSGRTHYLHSAGAILRGDEVLWSGVTTTAVRLRKLREQEIDAYVLLEDVRFSCGSYRIEGLGRHLIERIDGDAFAIAGLPITEMLAALYHLNILRIGS